MMRFLADENVSRFVIEGLRAAGFDVTAIVEAKAGASDKDVLELANAGDFILITEDRDFGELIIRQRLSVAGAVLLELDRLTTIAEAELVVGIVSNHGDKIRGNFVVIEPGRTRMRPLPPRKSE